MCPWQKSAKFLFVRPLLLLGHLLLCGAMTGMVNIATHLRGGSFVSEQGKKSFCNFQKMHSIQSFARVAKHLGNQIRFLIGDFCFFVLGAQILVSQDDIMLDSSE